MSQNEQTEVIQEETEVVEEVEAKEETAESQEEEKQEETLEENESETDVYSFGDEDTPPHEETQKDDPEWLKNFRKEHKETVKQKKQLEKELEELKKLSQPKEEEVVLGARPKLEDYDYDEDEYNQALDNWFDTKTKLDKKQKSQQDQQKKQEEIWLNKLEAYGASKESLNVDNFDEAEDTVKSFLDEAQQSLLIHTSLNASQLVYALGNNENKLKELSEIKDHSLFVAHLARMESNLKTSKKRTQPKTNPEEIVKGGGGSHGNTDKQLEKLREEASRTGDYSKVRAFKRNMNK